MKLPLLLSAALHVPSLVFAQYSWQMQFASLPAFSNPVELVHAYDGTNRLFVIQQRGIIYVFENEPAVSSRRIFLNISDRVSPSGFETGLLGLAFHPSYPDSPYFYVNYTSSSSGALRSYIARYTVSSAAPDSALYDSEIILFTVDQPYQNHNGGKLAFGPDGYLYIGLGDGGSANDPGNRAQSLTTILGKILRIDIDGSQGELNYKIPPTNPFYQNTSGYREEIYAHGIRNPWKFSFDPLSATLWLGDVGQDAREEIDTVINGGNYGWPFMEGAICTPGKNPTCSDTAGLLLPVYDYLNQENPAGDGSITGGYVYRGAGIPSLYGKYIYGDYVSGRTFFLTYEGEDSVRSTLISDESYSISAFGVDTSENIYLCAYNTGRIYKLVEQPTSVETKERNALNDEYRLSQNYPNPFNPATQLTFHLPTEGNVILSIYNLLGKQIAILADGRFPQGEHSIQWNAAGATSGLYIAKFSVLDEQQHLVFSSHKKLLLIK